MMAVSVCRSVSLCHTAQLGGACAVCVGLFVAAFVKSLWPLVYFAMINVHKYLNILFNKVDIFYISCIIDMMKTNSTLSITKSITLYCFDVPVAMNVGL